MKNTRLWRCPKCRRWLPQRNAVHACAPLVPLAAAFRRLLAEAYKVGQQKHLRVR